MVSTTAFHARVRGSVPSLGGLKETKMFLLHLRVKLSIVGNLCDREVACSASDRQGSNLEFCVWRTVLSHSSHHPQEVLLALLSLYVHKGGLKPDSFHFISFVCLGGGPRVVDNTAAFHARVRGSVPGLGGLKETKNVSSPSKCESQYCGVPSCPRGNVLGLRPPGLEFRILCLEGSVISIISPSQFSLYVHKGGLKPDSFHFICLFVTFAVFLKLTHHFVFTLEMIWGHLIRRPNSDGFCSFPHTHWLQ